MELGPVLTQVEADELIKMMKRFPSESNLLRDPGLIIPCCRENTEFDVVGDTRDDLFAVNIFRKGIASEKCTYQLFAARGPGA